MDIPPLPDFEWRKRLRNALDRSRWKRSEIARRAGTTPETVSRILTGAAVNPAFELVVRIAHAAGESVGWVLGEPGYELTAKDRDELLDAAKTIFRLAHDEQEEEKTLRMVKRMPE